MFQLTALLLASAMPASQPIVALPQSSKPAVLQGSKAQTKPKAKGKGKGMEKAEGKPAMKAELPSAADADDPALATMARFIKSLKVDKSQPNWKTNLSMPPKLEFTEGVDYFWNLQTNKGRITVKLMPSVAPMHVSSTIFLSRLGFYDDISFHRVITNFMAQGGCPVGRGTGNPGYKYDGEFDPTVKHDRPGLLSMANAGPGTDGSQFFLTFVPTPHLDGKHTIFGAVERGMDTVKELEKFGSARTGETKEPLTILKTSITIAKKDAKEAGGMEKMK